MRPADLSAEARDLFDTTMAWTRQWYDPSSALVWNPAGSGFGGARRVHLTPNSARFAYGLLARGSSDDEEDAIAIIAALIALQYPLDDGPAAGTYRIVLEAPDLPSDPQIWTDYDPNWRQFVGTAFAMMVEDFEERLPATLVDEMLESIRKAVDGERDGRIPVNYTNPALLRCWVDAWTGIRLGRSELVARGERFAREIATEFDRWGAFDEFNSPTYYGVDLAALALWRSIPTTDLFDTEGRRIEAALWRTIATYYNPALRNFCGPYTRSYHPDATSSLSEVALWIWAAFGRDAAPLPDLTADAIHHSHDLMWGPLVARLSTVPDIEWPRSTEFEPRQLHQELAGQRRVDAHVEPELMIGVETSEHDWGGWDQFMPVVAHWRDGDAVCVLDLEQPRVVRATLTERAVELELPRGPFPATFAIHADRCTLDGSTFTTGSISVRVETPSASRPHVSAAGKRQFRLTVPLDPSEPRLSLRFD